MATKIERAETKLEDARDNGDIDFWRKRLDKLQYKENKLQDKEYELLKQRTLLLSKFLLVPLCRWIFCDCSNFLFLIWFPSPCMSSQRTKKKDSQSAGYEFVTLLVALLSNLPLFLSLYPLLYSHWRPRENCKEERNLHFPRLLGYPTLRQLSPHMVQLTLAGYQR